MQLTIEQSIADMRSAFIDLVDNLNGEAVGSKIRPRKSNTAD